MSKIRSADHMTDEELILKMETSETRQQFRRWQAVYLIQTQQLSSAEIAEIVRAEPGTVLQWVHLYKDLSKNNFTNHIEYSIAEI